MALAAVGPYSSKRSTRNPPYAEYAGILRYFKVF